MLEKIKKGLILDKKNLPKHIAIVPDRLYDDENSFLKLKSAIELQVKLHIPILTFMILPEEEKKNSLIENLAPFLDELADDATVNQNQMKISVIGKWFDLPNRAVDSIRKVIDATKGYDKFFVNLCVNYSGQEEIVDSVRLIARQIKSGKLDPEAIDNNLLKENLYTSYFIPVDLYVVTGGKKSFDGLLLWDSSNARMFFSEKRWAEFGEPDFVSSLLFWQKSL